MVVWNARPGAPWWPAVVFVASFVAGLALVRDIVDVFSVHAQIVAVVASLAFMAGRSLAAVETSRARLKTATPKVAR